MTQEPLKVWSWRQAVAKAKLEPSTKLILYTLANYMNEMGGGCYPTIDTLVEESAMARATVIAHLDKAEIAGYIRRKKHGFAGQKWARNEYCARYPSHAELEHTPAQNDEENNQKKGSSAIEPPLPEVVQSATEGGSIDGQKAVQPLNSNSPTNSSTITPLTSQDSNSEQDGAVGGGGLDKKLMMIWRETSAAVLKILNWSDGDTRIILRWLQDGAHPELHIRETVRVEVAAKLARGEKINSLAYFEQPVRRAMAKPIAAKYSIAGIGVSSGETLDYTKMTPARKKEICVMWIEKAANLGRPKDFYLKHNPALLEFAKTTGMA